jgi:hypothetical protein
VPWAIPARQLSIEFGKPLVHRCDNKDCGVRSPAPHKGGAQQLILADQGLDDKYLIFNLDLII